MSDTVHSDTRIQPTATVEWPEPALADLRYYQPAREPAQDLDADVVVYGATSGGVTAAVSAARRGLSVVLASFDDHVGGMSAGGLGLTDVGHPDTIGGLARDFYREVAQHYRTPDPAWFFEPHVAEEILLSWLDRTGVRVRYRQHLSGVRVDAGRIVELNTDDGSRYRATVFIDATYEGDLLAAAGVSYAVGREANSVYGETINGVQIAINHQFERPVDPYVVPGQPDSGLLPGISPDDHGVVGEGDHRIQAYNFRLCVTRSANRVPFPRPEGYDPDRYELLRRYLDAGVFELYGRTCELPGGAFDMNNHGAFSSDHIGANYAWPDADYRLREEIFQDHVRYQSGLLYFLASDNRIPDSIRDQVNEYGLAPGEFSGTSRWPHQLYIREARRMVSDYVLTEHDGRGTRIADDPVALASYVMDSHNAKRVLVDGQVRNEGNVQVSVVAPFPVSYRAITPAASECENLLVVGAVSASHIAFSSIRMEPVFMMVGDAAGAAAALASAQKVAVQDVDYPQLRQVLEGGGAILDWKR